MMQQQEAINTCINNCLQSFGGIQNELLQARAQNAELRMQVSVGNNIGFGKRELYSEILIFLLLFCFHFFPCIH